VRDEKQLEHIRDRKRRAKENAGNFSDNDDEWSSRTAKRTMKVIE
jgi:hypothetical protein